MKVIYSGESRSLQHWNNPTGTKYLFLENIPVEMPDIDAKFYKEEAKKGGPWQIIEE